MPANHSRYCHAELATDIGDLQWTGEGLGDKAGGLCLRPALVPRTVLASQVEGIEGERKKKNKKKKKTTSGGPRTESAHEAPRPQCSCAG